MKHAKGCDVLPEKLLFLAHLPEEKMRIIADSRSLSTLYSNFRVMNNITVNPFAGELRFLGIASFAGNKHKKPSDVTDYTGICS